MCVCVCVFKTKIRKLKSILIQHLNVGVDATLNRRMLFAKNLSFPRAHERENNTKITPMF